MPPNKSSAPSLWRDEAGAELKELYDGGETLGTLLPSEPAIYLWKLSIAPSVLQRADPLEYAKWLDDLCSVPFGRVVDTQLCHYLLLAQIELRGRGLPPPKKRFFERFLTPGPARRWMTDYIAGLNSHLPSLYVGETDNLQNRILQHMAGDSVFGAQVREIPELDWRKLHLHYAVISNKNSEGATAARQAIEYLTSCLTIAGFTRRPG